MTNEHLPVSTLLMRAAGLCSVSGVTVAQRVQGDQDGESSVVGGVLQMHLAAVLSRLFLRCTNILSALILCVCVFRVLGRSAQERHILRNISTIKTVSNVHVSKVVLKSEM